MHFQHLAAAADQADLDCLVLPAHADTTPALDALASAWEQWRARGVLPQRRGQFRLLPAPEGMACDQVLLAGTGEEPLSRAQFAKLCFDAGRQLREMSAERVGSLLDQAEVSDADASWKLRTGALQLESGAYRYTQTKPSAKASPVEALFLPEAADIKLIAGLQKGVARARELANLPPNVCNPAFLAEQAREIAEACDHASVEVLERPEMEELGMGALLAVAAGSDNAPRLIVLRYRNGGDEAPYGLVGKGITFDTGGISLKPGKGMEEMKFDMGGAAGVIGAFESVCALELPINLTVVVPAVENMPDGKSYRPGDVVTSMSGQTIEVLNTDAEGRMILCDALTYIQRDEPQTIIDCATLTGACVIALGHHASGLMTHDDELAQQLVDAGVDAHDRCWRLPLWEEYQSQLDSPCADMANVGGVPAGSITAGCFLSRFVKDQRWAHLDIAGAAWQGGKKDSATGRPVGLLVEYLRSKH